MLTSVKLKTVYELSAYFTLRTKGLGEWLIIKSIEREKGNKGRECCKTEQLAAAMVAQRLMGLVSSAEVRSMALTETA